MRAAKWLGAWFEENGSLSLGLAGYSRRSACMCRPPGIAYETSIDGYRVQWYRDNSIDGIRVQ